MAPPARSSASRSSTSTRARRQGLGRDGADAREAKQAGTAPPDPAPPDPAPADPAELARQICLHQLEHAPRTRTELASALRRKAIAEDVAEEVLTRFADVGIIDDALFARLWVSSRSRSKGLAGRALGAELRRKGVDDATVAEALAGIDPDAELTAARALVGRRIAATAGLAPDTRVRRLAGMLARKGYPAGTAFRVVREALAAQGEQVEGLGELDAADIGGADPALEGR